MAITPVGSHALQPGTSSVVMVPPAGSASGDREFLALSSKLSTSPPATPTGFTQVGQGVVGTGANGAGTGPLLVTVWARDLTGAAGNTTISIPSGNAATAGGIIVRKGAGEAWPPLAQLPPAVLLGSDTTSGTPFAAAMAAQAGYAAGDICWSFATTSANSTNPSARAISIPGCTLTVTGIDSGGTPNGNDLFVWTDRALVTAGAQTGAGSTTATLAVASTGGAAHVRINLADQGAVQSSAAAATSSIDGASTSADQGALQSQAQAATSQADGSARSQGALAQAAPPAAAALAGGGLAQGAAAQSAQPALSALAAQARAQAAPSQQAQPASGQLSGQFLSQGQAGQQAAPAQSALAGSALSQAQAQAAAQPAQGQAAAQARSAGPVSSGPPPAQSLLAGTAAGAPDQGALASQTQPAQSALAGALSSAGQAGGQAQPAGALALAAARAQGAAQALASAALQALQALGLAAGAVSSQAEQATGLAEGGQPADHWPAGGGGGVREAEASGAARRSRATGLARGAEARGTVRAADHEGGARVRELRLGTVEYVWADVLFRGRALADIQALTGEAALTTASTSPLPADWRDPDQVERTERRDEAGRLIGAVLSLALLHEADAAGTLHLWARPADAPQAEVVYCGPVRVLP
jgi:hypothetical protein